MNHDFVRGTAGNSESILKKSDEAHELALIGLDLGLSRIIVMIDGPIKFVFELLGVQKFTTFCEHCANHWTISNKIQFVRFHYRIVIYEKNDTTDLAG